MILTWIAITTAGILLTSAIIAYWNDIVNWAKKIVAEGAKKAKLAIQYIKGELIPSIQAFFEGRPAHKGGVTKPMTPEQIREWGEAIGLTEKEIQDLIEGKTIYTDID